MIKYFGCKARLFFFGCKARLLLKQFGCKARQKMTEASTSMLIPTIPHCASDDQEATPFNGNMDRHHCQDSVWLTVRCLNWQCIYKWYIIQCCRGLLKNICANSGCKARLFKNSLAALKDFCFIILGAKQEFCSNILGAKQEMCSKILGAKQRFCSNILGAKKDFLFLSAKQDFFQPLWVQSKTFVQTFLVQINTFVQKFRVQRQTFVPTCWVQSKTFDQTFKVPSKTFVQTFWCKGRLLV